MPPGKLIVPPQAPRELPDARRLWTCNALDKIGAARTKRLNALNKDLKDHQEQRPTNVRVIWEYFTHDEAFRDGKIPEPEGPLLGQYFTERIRYFQADSLTHPQVEDKWRELESEWDADERMTGGPRDPIHIEKRALANLKLQEKFSGSINIDRIFFFGLGSMTEKKITEAERAKRMRTHLAAIYIAQQLERARGPTFEGGGVEAYFLDPRYSYSDKLLIGWVTTVNHLMNKTSPLRVVPEPASAFMDVDQNTLVIFLGSESPFREVIADQAYERGCLPGAIVCLPPDKTSGNDVSNPSVDAVLRHEGYQAYPLMGDEFVPDEDCAIGDENLFILTHPTPAAQPEHPVTTPWKVDTSHPNFPWELDINKPQISHKGYSSPADS